METRKAKLIVLLASIALLLTACIPVLVGVDAPAPYYYSASSCAGCWYGEWGGRTGYHQGGGNPWEGPHSERDHLGNAQHEGHR